jgi:hypothetical protein
MSNNKKQRLITDFLLEFKNFHEKDILLDSSPNEAVFRSKYSLPGDFHLIPVDRTFSISVFPSSDYLLLRLLDVEKEDQRLFTTSVGRRSLFGQFKDQQEPGKYIAAIPSTTMDDKILITKFTNDVLKSLDIQEFPSFEPKKTVRGRVILCSFCVHNSVVLSAELKAIMTLWPSMKFKIATKSAKLFIQFVVPLQ